MFVYYNKYSSLLFFKKKNKKKKQQFIQNVCYLLLFCVCRAIVSVCFCVGYFVMLALNLALSTLFATIRLNISLTYILIMH